MKLLIFELSSSNPKKYKDIFSEGFSMLFHLCKDLSKFFDILTILDPSLKKYMEGLKIKEENNFDEALDKVDFSLIIAPEHDGSLENLVRRAERKISFNCKADTIKIVSDKYYLYNNLEKKGLKVAKYEGKFPAVLKPRKGTSCFNIRLIKDEKELESINLKDFIIQEFIPGISLSLSIIVRENGDYDLLSINEQKVNLGYKSSQYLGGIVPYPSKKEELKNLTEIIVSTFKGLRGYIGVDLIFDGKEFYIMDLNPRITTSYLGLSLASKNLPEVLFKGLIGKEKENLIFHSFCAFKKVKEVKDNYDYISPRVKNYPLMVAKLFNSYEEAKRF
ncbi:hypothetical protein HRbin06_00474 [archaeon HR06]|nr:hypothetical protein HRbin06_00474 [archaeon HR06]